MKKCKKCEIEKELSEFGKEKRVKDGLKSWCRKCVSEGTMQWNLANKKKTKEYNKKYRQTHKQKISEYNKKWRQNNEEHSKEYQKQWRQDNYGYKKQWLQDNYGYQNKWKKNKRDTDPLFKLKENLRNRTSSAFRNMGYSKTSKTQETLGVSWEIVKSHIERQFTKGMSWDNQGEWHIDHIIPLASANTEKELLKLCHYSNLQPLWAKDNLSKSDKIVESQVKLRI